MRISILSTIIAVAIILGFSQFSFARCDSTGPDQFECNQLPPNPDPNGVQQETNDNGVLVNVLPDGNIDTGNFAAIELGDGANRVDINRATVIGGTRAIQTYGGPDEIIVNRANLSGVSFTIDTGGGIDNITVKDSTVRSTDGGFTISVSGDNDNVEIYDSTVTSTGGGFTINLSSGDDTAMIVSSFISSGPDNSFTVNGSSGIDDITVKDSTITAMGTTVALSLGSDDDKALIVNSSISITGSDFPVKGGTGDDEITLGGFGSDIPGIIDCDDEANDPGNEGFDTLIFALEVQPNQIAPLTQQIENLPTPDGSITINGFLYTYINCDEIVANLRRVEGRPIPTLSEWGLIATAGLLGVISLFAIYRRKITA